MPEWLRLMIASTLQNLTIFLGLGIDGLLIVFIFLIFYETYLTAYYSAKYFIALFKTTATALIRLIP